MLNIIVTNRETGKKQRYKFVQHAILIGRQQNCDVMLESTRVSRRHAKVTVNKDLVEVEDLGSGNGTVINHRRILEHKKVPIKAGDKLRIEEFEIELTHESSSNPLDKKVQPDVTDPDIIEIKMIKKVLGALDQDKLPSIVVVSEEFSDKKAVLDEGDDELVIGREETCDLSIDSNVISRKHAVITVKWGQFVVIDNGSKNGTYVNGEKIEEKSIKDGDEIVFGTIKTLFKNPQEFNIDAITKSITEDKKQEKQKPKPSVKEEAPVKEGVSEAAKSSVALTKEGKGEDEKPEDQGSKAIEAMEKGQAALDEQAKEGDKKEGQAKEAVASKAKQIKEDMADNKGAFSAELKKKASKMDLSELILFGFGALVVLIVIIVLIMIFL